MSCMKGWLQGYPPHTPTDTLIFTVLPHAPGWAGHWCMYTPDIISTCTSVTYSHHSITPPPQPPHFFFCLSSPCVCSLSTEIHAHTHTHTQPSRQLSWTLYWSQTHVFVWETEQYKSSWRKSVSCSVADKQKKNTVKFRHLFAYLKVFI